MTIWRMRQKVLHMTQSWVNVYEAGVNVGQTTLILFILRVFFIFMLHNTVVEDDSNNEAKWEKYTEGKRLPYVSFDGLKYVEPALKIAFLLMKHHV